MNFGPFEGNDSGFYCLVLLFMRALAIAFMPESFASTGIFPDLKTRSALNFLNHIFPLELSFEASQGILKRFTLSQPGFSQESLRLPTCLAEHV